MKNNLKKKLIKNNPIDVKDSQVDYATLQVQDESRSNRSIGEIKPISIPFKTILFTSIFLWAGAMSYYDFPQIYTQYLIDYFSVQNIDIEYLYSAVQVPNIILSLIASFIMDRTGLGLGNLIFQLIVMIGLIVNYYAFAQTNFLWMFIGRAIFGLGAEVTFVAQIGITDQWFNGKFLSIAYSLNRLVTYSFVSGSTFWFTNVFLDKKSEREKRGDDTHEQSKYAFKSVIMYYMGGLSLIIILSIIYYIIEIKNLGNLKLLNKMVDEEPELKPEEVFKTRQTRTKTAMSSVYSEGRSRKPSQIPRYTQMGSLLVVDKNDNLPAVEIPIGEKGENLNFSVGDFKRVPLLGWLLLLYFSVIVNVFFMMNTFCTDLLVQRFQFQFQDAKNVVALIPIAMMILIPIFSIILGRIGKKGIAMVMATLISILSLGIMLMTPEDNQTVPFLCMMLFASFWSLQTASFWSSFSLSIPLQAFTIFVGMTVSGQNLFATGLSLLFGWINHDRDAAAYQKSIWVLLGMSAFSLLLSVWVLILDFRTGSIIHLPENDPRVKKLREKKALDFAKSKSKDSQKKKKVLT